MTERVLAVDSREQRYAHVSEYFDRIGLRYVRTKLFCGDFAWLDDMTLCVDRKYGLSEVAGNLCQQHDRFRMECLRAQENGIRLVVLIEEPRIKTLADVATWQNPRMKKWEQLRAKQERGQSLTVHLGKPPVNGERLMKAMQTMAERYSVEWRFTEKALCGAEILNILGSLQDSICGVRDADKANNTSRGFGKGCNKLQRP